MALLPSPLSPHDEALVGILAKAQLTVHTSRCERVTRLSVADIEQLIGEEGRRRAMIATCGDVPRAMGGGDRVVIPGDGIDGEIVDACARVDVRNKGQKNEKEQLVHLGL